MNTRKWMTNVVLLALILTLVVSCAPQIVKETVIVEKVVERFADDTAAHVCEGPPPLQRLEAPRPRHRPRLSRAPVHAVPAC